MLSALTAKESLNADTPLLFFDCMLADGSLQRWSSRTFSTGGNHYEGRVLRHSLFEAQVASDTQVGGTPKLAFELANADSRLSEIEQQSGFKGAQLTVRLAFVDLAGGQTTTDCVVVFQGLINPPDVITENLFRLSAMNRMSAQRAVLPEVRVQRLCPWRFPLSAAQRQEGVDGGKRGKYSPFFRCGYSADQGNGVGALNGDSPFTDCARTRADCEQRGMFTIDSVGRTTARFGGIEFVPPTILVRGAGQKNYSLSAVQDNQVRYNDFVPLVYGTQWHAPDVVFSRNDGNLTRMEVLLGMGEIQGILKVLVNSVEIPKGTAGINMTSTGWYNIISNGARTGQQDPNFANGSGIAAGDPYGSMAYLSVVVPNRVNDATSVPSVQVLMQGMKLPQYDENGDFVGEEFSSNPAWVLLDILMRAGYSIDEVDAPSFARAASYCDELITAQDPVGGNVQIPRFECNFALKNRRSAGEIVRAIRNASRIYLVLNISGKLEARIENTFALQQPVQASASNARGAYNGGWPAYEFDSSSIARNKDGSSSVTLTSKSAQETPNRLSVEFQDEFNQYQQDSLSLADGDDADLCGQEVAATWDAVGISNFNQATRMLLLGLNRALEGNQFVEFQTSVKALGLMPGDLITITYLKENLQRAPFRIVKITPGAGFRTAVILAQMHNDAWYSDAITGIVGGRGWQSGRGSGLPAPVAGTILDANGVLQLGVIENEITGSDGSASVELDVAFTGPSGQRGSLAAPLIGLITVTSPKGGTLTGGANYFYALSALDDAGGESPLSFVAQATVSASSDTNSVMIDAIALPATATGFHVYRGSTSNQLFRIASNQLPSPVFTDTGLPALTVLAPDPQFDHVNLYWRWEQLPETSASTHSSVTVGNNSLQLKPDQYAMSTVRITRGTGSGQERSIISNDSTAVTVSPAWTTEPDATSLFVISESSWRFGAKSAASPIPVSVPERLGAGVQLSARAASVANEEAPYELSPLTRWIIGQSGGLSADADVPPAPVFGVSISPARGGVLDLSAIAFETLTNTRSIIGGTYKFYYYDEVYGDPPITLTAALAAGDVLVRLSKTVPAGSLLQFGKEVLLVTGTDGSGNTTLTRAMHMTTATSYDPGTSGYLLKEKIAIVPFVKNFFGSPASGDWKYSLEFPNVRLASAALYLTNALGNGATSIVPYTNTNDLGLRTLAGGQYSFQISGFLAIQTGAAPSVIVDADRAVRDIYGILRVPSQGAGVTLRLNLNGLSYATVQFGQGMTTSTVISGFGMTALHAGDLVSLDVTGVGTTNPGSDLTLVMRL
jgi:hypothetical protein